MKLDIVILEAAMPAMDAIKTIRELRLSPIPPHIVILTSHESPSMAKRALDAGASGFVLKSDPGNELKLALKAVLRGQKYLSSAMTATAKNRALQWPEPRKSSHPVLTNREMEILQLLSLGRSSKQIADNLAVSVRTVETHRANMMRKLGLHSVTEMLHHAFKNNVFERSRIPD